MNPALAAEGTIPVDLERTPSTKLPSGAFSPGGCFSTGAEFLAARLAPALGCFVSGHDFSRAVEVEQNLGFSPCAFFSRRRPRASPGL